MFDKEKFQDILTLYKKNFARHWPDEKYKWEVLKQFQDNWNIDAPDFAGMIRNSLQANCNLWASANYMPRKVIIELAKIDPDYVKMMFNELFDTAHKFPGTVFNFNATTAPTAFYLAFASF